MFEQKAEMTYFIVLFPPFSSPVCSHIINFSYKLLTHTPFSLVTTLIYNYNKSNSPLNNM